jgi:hypothetical protein
VPEYQITYWRDIPSLVVVRAGDEVTKAPLSQRFQEAIDDAAMRLGDISSDDYLAGWRRGDWTPADGTTASVADEVVARLEAEWSAEAVTAYLDTVTDDAPAADAVAGADVTTSEPRRAS